MGTRSDVGLAIKTAAWEDAPDWFREFWLREADDVDETNEEGRLFIIEDIKWYTDEDKEIRNVVTYLRERADDYYLVEACFDYPSYEGYEGGWTNNPWNLCLNISVSLSYEK